MMTQKTLEKLPSHVLEHIERLRTNYKRCRDETNRLASYNYTLGLKDAGLITEIERKALFVYTTI